MTSGALARPARGASGVLRLGRKQLGNVVYVVGLILVWELATVALNINSLLLPPPSAIAAEGVRFAELIFTSSMITLGEAVAGFIIAVVVGVGLAVVVVYSPALRGIVLSSIVAVNATPKVAVAPVLVIWLGLGLESKIAMAFLLSFFPIVINAIRGLADVPHDLMNLYRLMRASPLQVFLKVRLPNAMPALFDGMKIALPISMIGAVAGEFVAARQGIGYQIVIAYSNFNSELVFASVIVIAVLATLLFQVLVRVEDRVLHWRPSKQIF
jgi:NitT/TauT family transport system permease protein